MALFPNTSYTSIEDDHSDVLKRMETDWTNYSTQNLQYQSQADIDLRFYSGEQTIWNDYYGEAAPLNRKQFGFNKIRKIIQMPCGYQRENRKSTIGIPIENADQKTADQFTKILMWNDQQEGVLETISDAFTGALITGMNLLQVWVDYSDDPINGDIKIDNCSYNSFIMDPFWRKQDLSDCNSIWKRTYLSKEQVMVLLPDDAERIASMESASTMTDGKFQFMPEVINYDMKNLLIYDEYYYRSFRKQKKITDSTTGVSIEWKGDDDQLKEYLYNFPQVEAIDQTIPTVRLAIVVNGKPFYNGANPLGDKYPFVPVIAYYTPDLPYFEWRIQGMVRGLRDAQFLYNRRKVTELDIIESQVNSGIVAKEGTFIDPKAPYKTGQGQVLWLDKDAQMTDFQQIPAPQIPPSMFQLSEVMNNEMMDISGVNEELLGSATDDKAGVLSMLRQGAGLKTLRSLFDQLDYSQKLLGRLRIDIIQSSFTPAKVARIINEEPSQQFYDKDFGKYDVAIEEGFNTTTQKQLQFAQLLNLREVGVPVPSSILIETATIQDKEKLIAAIQQEEQQKAQMEQAQAQVAIQEQQAMVQMAQARAAADIGSAQEKASKIPENKAKALERIAAANKADEDAVLNKIKIIKELQDVDIGQLQQLLVLADQIKQQEHNQQREAQVQQDTLMSQLSILQNSGISNQGQPGEEPPLAGQ